MNLKRSEELLNRYLNGTCTAEEAATVESWYYEISGQQKDNLPEPDYIALKQEVAHAIGVELRDPPVRVQRIWSRIAVAAAILLMVTVAFLIYNNKGNESKPGHEMATAIAPGGNKALLTLANGHKIALTDIKNGEIVEHNGVKISKTHDGQLVYRISDLSKTDKGDYNIIETPTGGTYQILLPDGSRIWLNAASSIRYPLSFNGLPKRRIELVGGEAYFEIAKDKKHPFLVEMNQQVVEVLGTHFNINSYTDESATKTTLLEGAIRIVPIDAQGKKGISKLLKPNQQAVLTNGEGLNISNVDTEEAVAWKSGYFIFHNEGIESVMRKIARWYNVKVQYEGKIPSRGLGGSMSRGNDLSKVLNMLQVTGLVKFSVKGKTVIVSDPTGN